MGKVSEREAEDRLGASVRAGEPDWVTDGGGAVQGQDQGQVAVEGSRVDEMVGLSARREPWRRARRRGLTRAW